MSTRRKKDDPATNQRQDRVQICRLPAGVPGLDEILGGGLPEYSFNIIAGAPGSGKTTLAHQIMFANASPTTPALYFTVLGEPAIKMLRYQQQFAFFDQSRMDGPEPAIRFVNLSQIVLEQDLGAVLDEIIRQVEATNARIVVVDSFRTVVRKAQSQSVAGITGEMELQGFVQRLALHLTSWQATTFLIGEYVEGELRDNPVFTVADGLLWLYQTVERNSIVRRMQVMKLRGQASVPGMHTFRITDAGVQAFPRTFGLSEESRHVKGKRRMIAALTRLGVTIVSTVEIEEDFTSMVLSKFTVSFLADDILRMRYVSINGQFRKMLMVVKMRRSAHSIDMHEYRITRKGLVIGEPLRGYRGLTSGIPEPWSVESGQNDPELRPDRPPGSSPVKPLQTLRRKKRD
jgi:KaiC/GvpD/RAD55 family RecA-like ATPase